MVSLYYTLPTEKESDCQKFNVSVQLIQGNFVVCCNFYGLSDCLCLLLTKVLPAGQNWQTGPTRWLWCKKKLKHWFQNMKLKTTLLVKVKLTFLGSSTNYRLPSSVRLWPPRKKAWSFFFLVFMSVFPAAYPSTCHVFVFCFMRKNKLNADQIFFSYR